ncbi:hypothetical protein RCH18_002738 [Flavobacterium sp. PL11]|jgi:hypothetical protein|nr:hypothetical protein [Flavobacterium sp. PL11]
MRILHDYKCLLLTTLINIFAQEKLTCFIYKIGLLSINYDIYSSVVSKVSINISIILMAASLIFVPGPKTATAPASNRNW